MASTQSGLLPAEPAPAELAPAESAPAEPAPQPKPKVSVSQLRILLTAIERNPWLYHAPKYNMVVVFKSWTYLSNKLNECLDGATLDAQNWKHVLHHWADNVMNGDVLSKERLAYNKANPALTLKQAKELTRLERRFYRLLKEKKDDVKDVVDVTNTGKFGADKPKSDIAGASAKDVKVKVQLMNVFPLTVVNDGNVRPNGLKKTTIQVKEDEPTGNEDTADETKQLKILFDENLAQDDEEAENKQILAMTLECLQMVSRELENHIASVQRRIHMIKDMWGYSCEDTSAEDQ